MGDGSSSIVPTMLQRTAFAKGKRQKSQAQQPLTPEFLFGSFWLILSFHCVLKCGHIWLFSALLCGRRLNQYMRLGLLLLVTSLVGFSVSQLYIVWLLDVYTVQIPEYIRQKVGSPYLVLEVRREEPPPIVTVFPREPPMVSDLVYMFNDVAGFANAVSRLCENGECRVVLYLFDGHYYVESRVAGSELSYLIGFNIKHSAMFWFPGQFLSFLSLFFGIVFSLCLIWKAKNIE